MSAPDPIVFDDRHAVVALEILRARGAFATRLLGVRIEIDGTGSDAIAGELAPTASAARLHEGFGHDVDVDRARAGAHRLFRVLDEHLWFAEQEGRDWLCGPGHPTIADIACFPGVMLSEEGGSRACPTPRSAAGRTG